MRRSRPSEAQLMEKSFKPFGPNWKRNRGPISVWLVRQLFRKGGRLGELFSAIKKEEALGILKGANRDKVVRTRPLYRPLERPWGPPTNYTLIQLQIRQTALHFARQCICHGRTLDIINLRPELFLQSDSCRVNCTRVELRVWAAVIAEGRQKQTILTR